MFMSRATLLGVALAIPVMVHAQSAPARQQTLQGLVAGNESHDNALRQAYQRAIAADTTMRCAGRGVAGTAITGAENTPTARPPTVPDRGLSGDKACPSLWLVARRNC